jgi:hypothetical protein
VENWHSLIERTSSSQLRCLAAAVHVERWSSMQLRRLFVSTLLFACSMPTLASMVWSAVAIDPALVPRVKTDGRFLEQLLDDPPKDRSVYLDKSWHGIHFLLTGSALPSDSLASKVIFGGESIGPDQGYGPAQLLTPSEVKQVAELLSRESSEMLAERYDPQAMERAKVYPTIIWVREGQGALQYELQFYRKLVKFYQEAARDGNAVVFVVH